MLGAKSRMIDFGENVAQCVRGTDSSSAKSIMERRSASALSYAVVARTCGHWRNANRETKGKSQHGRHWHQASDCTNAQGTREKVEDGMARWTSPASVERRAFVVTA